MTRAGLGSPEADGLCQTVSVKEIRIKCKCQTPTCHLLQARDNQVPILYKPRLALTGGSWVTAWTEFGEAQSQCKQTGLCTKKSPLQVALTQPHWFLLTRNGSHFSAAEARGWGLRHRDGTRCGVRFCSFCSPPAEDSKRYDCCTSTFHQCWSIYESV